MGTNGQPNFTQPYKTKFYFKEGGSNWSRSPRAKLDPQEMRCWGESCEMEKVVRSHAYRQMGIKERQIKFPPRGVMCTELPGDLRKMQDTPRSTYQLANEYMKQPRTIAQPLYSEDLQKAVDEKRFNLKKGVGQADYDKSRGDHDIFNMGEKLSGRKKIQLLRAKVAKEREARRESEYQLKSLMDRVGVSPRAIAPPPAAAPAADPHAAYTYASPRGDVYVSRSDGPYVTPRDGMTMRVAVVRDRGLPRQVLVQPPKGKP